MDAFARTAAMGRKDLNPANMFGGGNKAPSAPQGGMSPRGPSPMHGGGMSPARGHSPMHGGGMSPGMLGGGMPGFPPMDDIADKLQALEDTNKVLQNELQKTETQSREDKKRIDTLNNELRDLQNKYSGEREKYRSQYEKMSEKYTNDTSQLRQENEFLRTKMESQKETVEKNEKKMAEVMEENRDLSMIKKDLLMNHMAELETLHEKLKQANKQIAEQKAILTASKSERASKESVYHDEIVQLKKDNDAFIEEIKTQRLRIDELETQNKDLAQKVTSMTADRDRIREEYETNIAIERSSVTGEKEKHDQEMKELEEKYRAKMQEDRDLFEQTLENEINKIKKEYKEEQLKDRDHFENTLEAEINRIKKEAADEQLKDRELFETTLETEINRMKEACEEEKRKYMSDYDSRETDYDVKLRTAHEQDAARAKELSQLRQALSDQEKELNERMKNELKKRDEEIRKLNECRMEMDRRIAEKDQALMDKDKNIQHMKEKVQEALRQSEENCRRCGNNFRNDKSRSRSVRVQTDDRKQYPTPSRVFMAKWSYNPKVSSPNEFPETELAFRAGDHILMEENVTPDGWFRGRLMNGEEGFVPLPFVEKIAEYMPSSYKNYHQA